MPYRKRGTLIPLELAILEVAIRRAPERVYGFALAQDLAGDDAVGSGLVAHGTLYKALDRLRRDGLLDSSWEDAEEASAAGRPRRRLYTVTATGRQAVTRPAAGRRATGEVTA